MNRDRLRAHLDPEIAAALSGGAGAGDSNLPTDGQIERRLPSPRNHGRPAVASTTKSPDEVVNEIKAYAETKHWNYLGAEKVKQDQVILVKLCIPEVGKMLWPVGLHDSAMLPCGNLGVSETVSPVSAHGTDLRL